MTTTIRFGTSNGPCGTTAEKIQLEDDTAEKGNCDPDRLLQCPYDKNHQIRACRFPYHLLKCRKNHPQLASELKTCPFNARHLVPKHELTHHTETCEDRISLDGQEVVTSNGHWKCQVPVSTWVNPDTSEDWDQEADDAAAPFVWGRNPAFNEHVEMRPNNNLGQDFRAPNTFPWSGFKP
ncbi:hypothetical protein INR49_000091 [Caranx melampygus]|nr:hypothetical protein INR49_000091 [Caranx melampygus]